MGALFVGFLATYSHTYSSGTKPLAAYYEKRYSTPIAAKTQRQGERIGGHHENGSLKIISLRINCQAFLDRWQPFNG